MFSFSFVKPQKKSTTAPPIGIDVKQRIAQLADAELLKSADAYFSRMSTDSIQYKKPFSDPAQSVQLTQHLGMLLQAADLFRGARVLDFGCATGWLSLGLAQMGCDVIGVDVAPSALKLAEKLKTTRRVASDGRMEFHAYEGARLPLADDSVDRIVCFDAFHHVRDQAATLKEFARVLKQGGRIAFVEPGPEHSKTRESQTEMAIYNVIENDVSLPHVSDWAIQAGLNAPEVLLQFQRPVQIGIGDFNRLNREGMSKRTARKLLSNLLNQMTDTQFFYIQKGQAQQDSRQTSSLGGALRLVSMEPEKMGGLPAIQFSMALRNTGTGPWLTATGVAGQVKLGAQLFAPDGALINLDYDRFEIKTPPVEVNQEVVVSGVMRLPAIDAYELRFDLVAEHVAWLSQIGKAQAVVLNSAELKQASST